MQSLVDEMSKHAKEEHYMIFQSPLVVTSDDWG